MSYLSDADHPPAQVARTACAPSHQVPLAAGHQLYDIIAELADGVRVLGSRVLRTGEAPPGLREIQAHIQAHPECWLLVH